MSSQLNLISHLKFLQLRWSKNESITITLFDVIFEPFFHILKISEEKEIKSENVQIKEPYLSSWDSFGSNSALFLFKIFEQIVQPTSIAQMRAHSF